MRILFSNVGYARGIDGTLRQHVLRAGRHFYCSPAAQGQALGQLKEMIDREAPDLCCFVEIDSGSVHSGRLNQIETLMDQGYRYFDIAGKYGETAVLGRLPLYKGKSSGFIARQDLPFTRHYFTHGAKRLIYSLVLPDGTRVFFAHFSLKRDVRARQMGEMRALIEGAPGEAVVLADFNIMHGFKELQPLLAGGLKVLNQETEPTFLFHRRRLALDLCLATPGLTDRMTLRIIPQPFSDHAALLADIAH